MSYESIKASFKELVESRGLLPVTVNEAMDIVATWQENRAEQASVGQKTRIFFIHQSY